MAHPKSLTYWQVYLRNLWALLPPLMERVPPDKAQLKESLNSYWREQKHKAMWVFREVLISEGIPREDFTLSDPASPYQDFSVSVTHAMSLEIVLKDGGCYLGFADYSGDAARSYGAFRSVAESLGFQIDPFPSPWVRLYGDWATFVILLPYLYRAVSEY